MFYVFTINIPTARNATIISSPCRKQPRRWKFGARANGMSYSQFIGKVKAKNIELNRKVLADLAMNNPEAFKAIVDEIK